jgi:hypothetical protein
MLHGPYVSRGAVVSGQCRLEWGRPDRYGCSHRAGQPLLFQYPDPGQRDDSGDRDQREDGQRD